MVDPDQKRPPGDPDTDLVTWLRLEADDWEPGFDLHALEGFRSPTGARLREAADEIDGLRAAFIGLRCRQITGLEGDEAVIVLCGPRDKVMALDRLLDEQK